MQAVMLSTRPEWCKKIATGEKTVEVRKTAPKLETPFKCFIYCTEQRRREDAFNIPISREEMLRDLAVNGMKCMSKLGNGKVWAEFTCDHVFQYTTGAVKDGTDISDADMERLSCLDHEALFKYENSTPDRDFCLSHYGLSGWHISGLTIYDKPRELAEFCTGKSRFTIGERGQFTYTGMTRPPKSWCYVEELPA